MNTKTTGDKSEAAFLAKFIFLNYVVLIPFGDNQRYDFVIDRGKGFERVQIKTGNLEKEFVTANVCSMLTTGKRKSYVGDIDLFGIYCPQLNTFYLIPIADIRDTQTEIYLRVAPYKKDRTVKKGLDTSKYKL